MSPDPFRISFLTITLDSQTVLAIIGLLVAGFVFRLAAGREGLGLRAGDWWDLVTSAIIAGRLLWVATHLDYYLRGPLQVVVIVDGGLHPVGLVFGAAYAIRGLRRRSPNASYRSIVELVALATLVAFTIERAGCALTTCGAGPLSNLPWALQRGEEWRQPLALYQSVVLVVTLLLATELRELRGSAFSAAFVALSLVELISLAMGGRPADSFPALGVALGLYLLAARYDARQQLRLAHASASGRAGHETEAVN